MSEPPKIDFGEAVANLVNGIKSSQRNSQSSFVLVSTAILEESLQNLLRMAMRPLSNELRHQMFERMGGPASTLFACTLVAYAFKVINKDLYNRLEWVRGVRNHFAHTPRLVSLESPEIQPLLLNLGWKNDSVERRSAWWIRVIRELRDDLVTEGKRFDG